MYVKHGETKLFQRKNGGGTRREVDKKLISQHFIDYIKLKLRSVCKNNFVFSILKEGKKLPPRRWTLTKSLQRFTFLLDWCSFFSFFRFVRRSKNYRRTFPIEKSIKELLTRVSYFQVQFTVVCHGLRPRHWDGKCHG